MKQILSKLMVILGILILCSLGIWQLFRMNYKEKLIQDLKAKSDMPTIQPYEIDEEYLYRKIELCGHFTQNQDLFVYFKPNYIILTPFKIDDDNRQILVARGIVKASDKGKDSFLIKETEHRCISGTLTKSEKEPIFMPAYDGTYQKPLLTINTKSAGNILGKDFYDMFVILSDRHKDTILAPISKPKPQNIYNNHLEYALTWFILAGILLFMYVTSKKAQTKKPKKKSK